MLSYRKNYPRSSSAALWVTLALLLAACGGTAATPAEQDDAPAGSEPGGSNGQLVVLDWSGYELPEFWGPFAEKHPDVTPDYSFFAEDAEAFAKLESGFEVDVVHPCNSWWGLYVENGAVQPIDTSRLSNWPDVRPQLAEQGVFDGKQYFIPWDWGFESILVRTDKVQTIPESWADLWNDEYAGHLSLYDSGEAAHAMTALALGFDPWGTTPEQDAEIKQKLIEIKPNLLNYWSDFTELNQLVASGDVWVAANAWNDAYTTAKAEGVPVEYINPKEGRLSWLCGYGISTNAKNADLAYDYLDALLAPDSMAFLSNEYAYGAASMAAVPLTDPEFVSLFKLDDPAVLDTAVFYKPLTTEQRERFTGDWSEVKASP